MYISIQYPLDLYLHTKFSKMRIKVAQLFAGSLSVQWSLQLSILLNAIVICPKYTMGRGGLAKIKMSKSNFVQIGLRGQGGKEVLDNV